MKIDEHIALLRQHDDRLSNDEAAKAIDAGSNQIIHYYGDDFVDLYLENIIPKTIPDAVAKQKTAIQVLSTFQSMLMQFRSIGVEVKADKFAEAMDLIISA